MTVAPLTIIPAAAARVKRESDFKRAALTVRYLLGCRGTGFRITVEQNRPGEGDRFEASEIPVVMDDEAFERLHGAVLDVDPGPYGEGYRLEHPDAVLTTFC